MKARKKRRLEAAGWRVGTVPEFLGLSTVESAFIEMKLDLAVSLKKTRLRLGLSQAALAKRLKSSQSRVAKMEAADSSVSLDLLVRAHLSLGAGRSEIARAVA